MESRRVYRGIEEAIRAGSCRDSYPHSFLSRRLRYDFMETADLRRMKEVMVLASSAMHSHSRMDIDSVIRAHSDMMSSLIGTIPYFSPNADEDGKSDRDMAVELFERVADRMSELAGRLASSGGKVDIESV